MSGRVMSHRRTVILPGGPVSGVKCPACPAVIQATAPPGGGAVTEREGLRQHWLVVHPERPFRERDAR